MRIRRLTPDDASLLDRIEKGLGVVLQLSERSFTHT